MVFIQNGNDWTRRCTANVAVFACSDQGREYHYSSPVAGGLDTVMD
uniref:Uncharacterized protein n=1 Tax=Brassica oleracea TaxID=3712 RepID=A0A3P6CK78_BRAOL|nr:unnamed protein product [Brassica oleracea]